MTAPFTRALVDVPEVKKGMRAPAPVPVSNAESKLSAQKELRELQKFFGDDTQAFRAVYCRALGMDVKEIQEELNIDSREWEAVRKRIQRKFTIYLQENREEK